MLLASGVSHLLPQTYPPPPPQMSKCDACRRQGKLIESLRWMGEMKHFCNLQCLLHFCSQRTPAVPPATGGVVASAPLPGTWGSPGGGGC